MTRPLRIEFPGALYHVTSRGDRKEDIFVDDADHEEFLEVLARVIERMGWRCYAYCLMGNHYHLLIETPEPNLARGMRQINGVYTQRFNRRHGRVGHVFQGRYKAIMVDQDSYLLELVRYVVLNPLRANLAKRPDHWRWSSYRATVGLTQAPAWLSVEWILNQFGKNRVRARSAYAAFVQEGKGLASVWERLRQQIYLGDEPFIQRMLSKARSDQDISEVPRIQRLQIRPLAWYEQRYKDQGRAMAEAYRSGAYTLAEIAGHFAVHYSTVSRAVKTMEVERVR